MGDDITLDAILVISLAVHLSELDLTVVYETGMAVAAALQEPGVAVVIDGDLLIF